MTVKQTLSDARKGEDQTTNSSPLHSTQTVLSDHGHSLSRISPLTRHPAESVSAWFTGLFTIVIGISTLGASITFSHVIGGVSDPIRDSYFSPEAVHLFLSISWLLFLLALAFASLASTILAFFKYSWRKDWNGEHGKTSQRDVQLYAMIATALLAGSVIAAFIFLCLVVTAYAPVIGWIALGFTSAFGLVCTAGVMFQVPWPWQDNQPKRVETH